MGYINGADRNQMVEAIKSGHIGYAFAEYMHYL